jgi:hypothetical protein
VLELPPNGAAQTATPCVCTGCHGRVNLFERWESQAAVKAFRRSAPRMKHRAATLSVSVAEYDIADVRPLFAKDRT